MLTKLLRDHQQKQTQLRDESDQKRRAALNSVSAVTSGLMDSVNSGVANVFANQRRLEQETRNLQSQTTRFSKQTTQWLTLVDNFNDSLKEIGDIENWAKTIENDMKSIAATLAYVSKPPNQQ
eukprot:TRINITY_DN33961_c0_g1_i1.p2 TRINITY_DN33961_c0_g1~~TRINITY_DN33961_c0_g1_i1.p2  ORF type:complete len:123 (+),score=43.90 TRINITY_DN33961_c0_g1_i1:109-477(+)